MESEKSLPLPLTGEEVQEGILSKLRDCMEKNCHLARDNAYTSVKFEIEVRMTLFDYGREVRNNQFAAGGIDSELPQESEPEAVEASVAVEPMPPNQFRQETDQAVPVATVVDGKKTVRHLRYAPRKAKV